MSKLGISEGIVDEQALERVTSVLKALSLPIRLRIVCELMIREKTPSELSAILNARPTLVSQLLAILRQQGLIAGHKDGLNVIYRIADQKAVSIINSLCRIYRK